MSRDFRARYAVCGYDPHCVAPLKEEHFGKFSGVYKVRQRRSKLSINVTYRFLLAPECDMPSVTCSYYTMS